MSRINELSYSPVFLNENYLFDRFEPLRKNRVNPNRVDFFRFSETGTVIQHYQLLLNSSMNRIDYDILPYIIYPFYSPLIVVIVLAIAFTAILFPGNRRRRYALLLYMIAGFVSIAVELIAFYLYQLEAGMLYSDISILISSFMLGLALGTYYCGRLNKENLEFPSLLLLLSSAFIFYMTQDSIGLQFVLLYHSIFLFVVAVATGSLFISATDRYYYGRTEANRGLGYAFEIGGAALGALTITTIIVPIYVANFVLVSLMILLIVTLIGALLTVNK